MDLQAVVNSGNPGAPRRRQIALAAALVAITLLTYLPAMGNGFIWDDDQYVTNNPLLRTSNGLRRIWLEPEQHTAVLSARIHDLPHRTWSVGPQAGRLPCGEHPSARGERAAALEDSRIPGRSGRLAGGADLRRASGERRVGGVGDGTQEHPLRLLLSRGAPGGVEFLPGRRIPPARAAGRLMAARSCSLSARC